jgi:hypothetical protein
MTGRDGGLGGRRRWLFLLARVLKRRRTNTAVASERQRKESAVASAMVAGGDGIGTESAFTKMQLSKCLAVIKKIAVRISWQIENTISGNEELFAESLLRRSGGIAEIDLKAWASLNITETVCQGRPRV